MMPKFKKGDVVCRFRYQNSLKVIYRRISKVEEGWYYFNVDGNRFEFDYIEGVYLLKKDFEKKHPEAFI